MKRVKVLLEWFFLALMVGLCAMILLAGSGNVPYVFGYRVLQVISHSMEPTIHGETCIVIKKVDQEEIKVGDIITFLSEEGQIKGYLNTHRVHEITTDSETGAVQYITKGDAYDTPDRMPVDYEQVKGRYVGELPFGELLFKGIRFIADRDHYFIIIILPLALCFMSYSKDLYMAIFHRKKSEEGEENPEGEPEGEALESEENEENEESGLFGFVKRKKSAEPEQKLSRKEARKLAEYEAAKRRVEAYEAQMRRQQEAEAAAKAAAAAAQVEVLDLEEKEPDLDTQSAGKDQDFDLDDDEFDGYDEDGEYDDFDIR